MKKKTIKFLLVSILIFCSLIFFDSIATIIHLLYEKLFLSETNSLQDSSRRATNRVIFSMTFSLISVLIVGLFLAKKMKINYVLFVLSYICMFFAYRTIHFEFFRFFILTEYTLLNWIFMLTTILVVGYFSFKKIKKLNS